MHLSSSVGDFIGYINPVQVEALYLGQRGVIVFAADVVMYATFKSVALILQGSFPST